MQKEDEMGPSKKCSKYFTFNDFFGCSDTYKSVLCDNVPKEFETFESVKFLACEILDKVQEEFGTVNLTYGFCSSQLNKHIPKNNYPKLDQHAGHELNRKGNLICERLGFAADFTVPGVSSLIVSRYIVSKLRFDRLYYYGHDRPIHVSLNKNSIYSVVLMRLHGARRIPAQITNEKFIQEKLDF
jgi:hypothetical protein